MTMSLPFILFLCISKCVFGQWIRIGIIDYEFSYLDDELSYQELVNINGSCYPLDTCMEQRTEDPIVPAFSYTCSCHKQCWELGTCCIDSPYRDIPPTQKCRNVGSASNRNEYYVVDRCPDNIDTNSVWKKECEKEWEGEDNILMLSPITSQHTSLTYKNYFCFKCHETTDKYVYWNLFVESMYSVPGDLNVSSVAYNQEEKTWMAIFDDNRISIPVNISFQTPYNLQVQPTSCNLNLISDCPHTWTDRRVREKCLAYTALVYRNVKTFKNPHCALCNYELLEDLTCISTSYGGYGGGNPMNFRTLLDINSSTEDKVGNDEKCDDGNLWDPFSKKCRKKTCAIPGYVIKDDKCAPA